LKTGTPRRVSPKACWKKARGRERVRAEQGERQGRARGRKESAAVAPANIWAGQGQRQGRRSRWSRPHTCKNESGQQRLGLTERNC
jgi:hypothetical protein